MALTPAAVGPRRRSPYHARPVADRTQAGWARRLATDLGGKYPIPAVAREVARAATQLMPSISIEALPEMVAQLAQHRLENVVADALEPRLWSVPG